MQWPEILFGFSSEPIFFETLCSNETHFKAGQKAWKKNLKLIVGEGKPLKLKTVRFLGKNWFQAKWKRICKLVYLLHESSYELIVIFPSGEPVTPNFPQLLHEALAGPAPAPAVSAVTGKLLSQGVFVLFCLFFFPSSTALSCPQWACGQDCGNEGGSS